MIFKRGVSAKGNLNIGNPLINKHHGVVDILKHLGFIRVKTDDYANYMDFKALPEDPNDLYNNKNILGLYVIEKKLLAIFSINRIHGHLDSHFYHWQKMIICYPDDDIAYWTAILYSKMETPEEMLDKFKCQSITKRLLRQI